MATPVSYESGITLSVALSVGVPLRKMFVMCRNRVFPRIFTFQIQRESNVKFSLPRFRTMLSAARKRTEFDLRYRRTTFPVSCPPPPSLSPFSSVLFRAPVDCLALSPVFRSISVSIFADRASQLINPRNLAR